MKGYCYLSLVVFTVATTLRCTSSTDIEIAPLGRRFPKLSTTLKKASSAVKSLTQPPLHAIENMSPKAKTVGIVVAGGAVLKLIASWIDRALWTPSRTYNKEENSVGREYDAWAQEGILEHYWGEHIHLGYYKNDEIPACDLLAPKKDFIRAKVDFIEEMLKFSGFTTPSEPFKVLDVGCGIGGTSRYLAKKFGTNASVTGITLSPVQAQRANNLATSQNISNAKFEVMDALDMKFPDNSFDLVWGCESGEHMPDKKQYIEEMARVLKPGGKIVVATWCQRDDQNVPFNAQEKRMLNFLYSEWTHPYFISIEEYRKIMESSGKLTSIKTDNWTKNTITSWLHSIWVGVFDPIPVFSKPKVWRKCFRDGLTLVRMHKSFKQGLMEYGMLSASKKAILNEENYASCEK